MNQPPENRGREAVTALPKRPRLAWVIGGFVFLWAVLYLPNLRTNPSWYGDEGEWMEKCWMFIHGTPRVGPIVNDFVFPYPYPPLYMLVNGAVLRVFGNDLVVGRALGAVSALAVAGILFWMGRRLKDGRFGLLCAAAWLVYPEAVMNFRWVRSHPMAGALTLACAGFLIAYLQEKQRKHLLWAGVMCSLATATHYYAVGMIPAVMVAAIWVNRSGWRQWPAWRDVLLAVAASSALGVLFLVWYLATQGGWWHLLEQVRRMSGFTPTPSPPEVLWRFVKFCFWTPIYNVQWKQVGVDVWLALAGIGLIVFPVKRWRGWLAFWMLLLMYPIFQKQMNVSFFFYPATIFLPLMTLGVAGTLDQAGRLVALWLGSKDKPLRAAWGGPAVAVLGVLGVISLNGSLGHFRTKIDRWTQRPESVCGAEAAMRIVNDNTTSEDVVIVPKQLYWLVEHAKKTMLSHCATYAGQTNDAWPVPIPREMFWFDADWRKAKYAVIASGISPDGRQQWGFDLVYTIGAGGAVTIVPEMLNEGWRVVYTDGRQVGTLAIPPDKKWPVAVSGEYIVLGNPRLLNAAPSPGIQE